MLAVVDIDRGAHEAAELTGGFVPRGPGVFNPPVPAAEPLQTILHAERLASAEAFQIRFQTKVAIVGMNAVQPAVPDFFLEMASAKLQPGTIEERAHAVAAGHPHHHRRRIGQTEETGLAGAHALFLAREVELKVRNFLSQHR